MAKKRSLTLDPNPNPSPAPVADAPDPAFLSTEPRILCALLLDVSASMASALGVVTDALPEFRQAILKDSLLTRQLSWAVITFSDSPRVVQGYGSLTAWEPPARLECGSGTAMGTAILETLRLQEEHIAEVIAHGISIQHCFCFLVTDGEPTCEPPKRFEEAAQLIEQLEQRDDFSFFTLAVEGANMEKLRQLTPRRTPLRLADQKDFYRFFEWLKVSMQRVSMSRPGERVNLANPMKIPENPLGWAAI